MSTVPAAKLVEPGQGKTIMLYAVRFDYRVTSADAGGALSALEVTIPPGTWSSRTTTPARTSSRWCWPGPWGPEPAEYDAPAERYGLTIQNDWIEELERTYKVKL
jgi:hypothetical protein